MRVPFLVLPPVCVLLGAGTAVWTHGKVNVYHLLLVFIGAMAAHVSVNALNEYFDFRSGLDARTQRTPFSGGSGTLQARPDLARTALLMGLTTMAVAGVIGLYFLGVRGIGLLPLGLAGLFLIAAYTPWLTRFPLLCLLAPGLGFGVLMVMGTAFVLTGEYTWTAFFASLVPTFLVSDLLLINQFPDVEADRSVGRRHYPITLGRRASAWIYDAFLLLAFLSIVVGVALGVLPVACLLGLLALLLAVPVAIGVIRHAEDLPRLIPYLAQDVLLQIATPLLVAIGLFIAAWLR